MLRRGPLQTDHGRTALSELVSLVADGRLEVPVAETFALEDVRDAFTTLEQRHTRGKLVLHP